MYPPRRVRSTAQALPLESNLLPALLLLLHQLVCSFLIFINEAYCKDFDIGNCHHCVMGWPSTNFCHSTKSYLVASNLFCRIFRMLWSIDGWSWSDEFSYLSSRSPLVAKGCS
ncbi:hypothetical protein P8452_59589 [Trifolium repens]|nr:hypothetical protein P8452_59589 [Trifolium repens]